MGVSNFVLYVTYYNTIFQMDYKSIAFVVFSMCFLATGYAEETQNNVTCIACEITVEALEEYINFGHNEEAIISNMTAWCHEAFDDLPPFIRPIFLDICIGFVNVTVRDIIDLLQDEMEPEHICIFLGLCDGDEFSKLNVFAKILEERKALSVNQLESHGPLVCNFCENAVDTIEELIGFGNFTWDGEVEQEIINQLIQNCIDQFPDSPIAEDTCEMVVNTFMKDLMDLFREVMEPEHLCEILGLCPIPDFTTTMLPN